MDFLFCPIFYHTNSNFTRGRKKSVKKRYRRKTASVALVLSLLVLITSCGKTQNNGDETNPATMDVYVFTTDIEFGKKITPDMVTTKTINYNAVSSTMITSTKDVVGKYASVDLYAGDFAYKGKVSGRKPTEQLDASEVEKTRNKYVDVSQFVEPNLGIDVYAALQEVIDNNKSKTIYFPDGEYIISKPLKTSAVATASTSLYLSDNAVIKASDNWIGTDKALIELGGAEGANNITTAGSNYFFIGGILDGNSKAMGISLVSGRESLVSKVKIVNATVGIHVPNGVNSGSSDMDIEDIHINSLKREVMAAGKPCSLTYKEYELLKYLALNKGIVLTRDKIMESVWGFDFQGESRTVDMHIKTLRQKLGECGNIIQTVRNVGYKML